MLVIIDPSLRSYMVHFLTYDKAIAKVVERLGVRCTVLASNEVQRNCIPDLNIVPRFSQWLEVENPRGCYVLFGACGLKEPDGSDSQALSV
jgi:hypothetical protein